MESSKLSYRKWLMAIFMMSTHLKGVASTKLANDINVTQKTAWFLAHRIRTTNATTAQKLIGQIEMEGAYGSQSKRNGRKKAGRRPTVHRLRRVATVDIRTKVAPDQGVVAWRNPSGRFRNLAVISNTKGVRIMLKRGVYGTYHNLSVKHLPRYIHEFHNRQNIRGLDTMLQLSLNSHGLYGKRLRYKELTSQPSGVPPPPFYASQAVKTV